jgi:adenine-specific DNA-methyltransferase
VLALTNEHEWVLDPFAGSGSTLLAALMHNRRAMGCEKEADYIAIIHDRIEDLKNGRLRHRPLTRTPS